MKLAVIGAGYVGLVSGACLAKLGHDVNIIDNNEEKIAHLKSGIMPIYESGLEDLISEGTKAGRLTFTSNLSDGVKDAQAIFIAVGTPMSESGAADLQYVEAVSQNLSPYLTSYKVIINKSTVPVGTAQRVKNWILSVNPRAVFDVASNPEFLREGVAIHDFLNPDRIVWGSSSAKASDILAEIYKPLTDKGAAFLSTTPETSELIKYASNAFLAAKVSFINEMANLCEVCGADVEDLAKGIGLDTRIGPKFLKPGPGFGGSCFPKDTEALIHLAREYGAPVHIIESVVNSNNARIDLMVEKISQACGQDLVGKKIAVLGLTFKAHTDDVRQSVSLKIIPKLQEAGALIAAYDPEGMETAREHLQDIQFADSVRECILQADAAVILTEWPHFANFDWTKHQGLMSEPVVVDLRNILDPAKMGMAGYTYTSLGRTEVKSKPLKQKVA